MKIAIIRLSSFGDIITTLVFLDLIKRHIPNAHITWIVDSSFRALLADSPFIDEICDIPLRASKKNKKLIFSVIKKIRTLDRFDIALDFQGLLKSAIIGKMLKTKTFVGYASIGVREKIASIFYTKKVAIPYDSHILIRQYAILKTAFGWEKKPNLKEFDLNMLDSRKNILRYSNVAQTTIQSMIKQYHNKILFVIEASKAEKEYGIDNFYRVAMGIKKIFDEADSACAIFLIWDKMKDEIRDLGDRDSIFCVLPHLGFDEIKALVANMDLVIGGDTGITHLAWAFCVPSITLYGNTPIKRVQLGGENHISICKIEQTGTIKGDFSIRQIAPNDIIQHAKTLLNKVIKC